MRLGTIPVATLMGFPFILESEVPEKKEITITIMMILNNAIIKHNFYY